MRTNKQRIFDVQCVRSLLDTGHAVERDGGHARDARVRPLLRDHGAPLVVRVFLRALAHGVVVPFFVCMRVQMCEINERSGYGCVRRKCAVCFSGNSRVIAGPCRSVSPTQTDIPVNFCTWGASETK